MNLAACPLVGDVMSIEDVITLLRTMNGVDVEIHLRFHAKSERHGTNPITETGAPHIEPTWYVECKDCGKWAGKYDSQEKANRALSSHRNNCPKYEYQYGVVDEAKLWISAMHEKPG